MIFLQTRALLVDAYRELNAKKLFWVVMVISALVMGAIACLGVYDTGMSVLGFKFDNPVLNATATPPDVFYKLAFVSLGIPVWLAWGATILALVSTAGMIPDFIAGGSIELSLSKPISRLRLFLTKYFSGLLFVFLQVLVFSIGGFLVIGIRGGSWEPGLFLAVPLVTLFFSYLFCVCALAGLLLRSTIAALLITIVFWLALFAVNAADQIVLTGDTQARLTVQRHEERIAMFDRLTAERDEAHRRYRNAMTEAGLADRFVPPPVVPAGSPASDEAESTTGGVPASEASVDGMPLGDEVAGLWLPFAPSDNTELRRLRREVETIQERHARSRRHIENVVQPGLQRHQRSANAWGKWQRGVFIVKTALPKTSETIELLRRWVIDAADLPSSGNDEQPAVDESTRALFGTANPSALEVNPGSPEFAAALRERIDARSPWWILGTSVLFQFVILAIACWRFVRRDF